MPTTGTWARAGTLAGVPPLDVSVWTVDLDQPPSVVDALRAHLDEAEVRAAASRSNDAIRDRYVVAHGALRMILGARLGIAPGAVEFDRRCARCGDPDHGKPAVVMEAALPADRLEFSLSHSESVAMVAVVTGARIGVDVEVERPRRHLDALAARVLAAEDHADWLDRSESEQLHAFLGQWTAKEAYLKAIGAGITVALRDVPVEPDGWTAIGVASPPDTVARIAVDGYAVVHDERWSPPAIAEARPTDSSRPIDKFRDTAVGSVLAAGLLGLRDALEPPKKDEVAIVQDYAGEPPFTDPYVLRLDPEHPEDSIVMVRPWLRDGPAEPVTAAEPPDFTDTDPPSPN
jgi:4'-phosphopantetheinyl transferase